MANFVLSVISVYLLAFNVFVAVSEASRSPAKKANRTINPPAWFIRASDKFSPDAWNIFGQWFNQSTSVPSGEYLPLREIAEAKNLWDFVDATEMNSIERIDISLFRPGLEPNFSKFVLHETGYVLSYEIKPCSGSIVLSPTRMSRNRAKLLKAASKSDSDGTNSPQDLAHFHYFDPLIDAVLKTEESASRISSNFNSDRLSSDIMGFVFKRQFERTFLQIFFQGVTFPSYTEAINEINKFFGVARPGIDLSPPHNYCLSKLSRRIVFGPIHTVHSPSKLSPKKHISSLAAGSDKVDTDSKSEPLKATESDFIVESESGTFNESAPASYNDSPMEEASNQVQDSLDTVIDDSVNVSASFAENEESLTPYEPESESEKKEEEEESISALVSSILQSKPFYVIPVFVPRTVEELLFERILLENLNFSSACFDPIFAYYANILKELNEESEAN